MHEEDDTPTWYYYNFNLNVLSKGQMLLVKKKVYNFCFIYIESHIIKVPYLIDYLIKQLNFFGQQLSNQIDTLEYTTLQINKYWG